MSLLSSVTGKIEALAASTSRQGDVFLLSALCSLLTQFSGSAFQLSMTAAISQTV